MASYSLLMTFVGIAYKIPFLERVVFSISLITVCLYTVCIYTVYMEYIYIR